MKICQSHLDRIRAILWQKGIKPSQDGAEAAGRGRTKEGDAYTMVQGLLLANVAKNFPAATLFAPAESCPFCHGAPEDWLQQACDSVELEQINRLLGPSSL